MGNTHTLSEKPWIQQTKPKLSCCFKKRNWKIYKKWGHYECSALGDYPNIFIVNRGRKEEHTLLLPGTAFTHTLLKKLFFLCKNKNSLATQKTVDIFRICLGFRCSVCAPCSLYYERTTSPNALQHSKEQVKRQKCHHIRYNHQPYCVTSNLK